MREQEYPSIQLRVRLFGKFQVEQKQADGTWKVVTAKWEKQARHLLSYLLCTKNRKDTRSNLTDALWPDSDSIIIDKYLHNAVYYLRQVLGDFCIAPYGGKARDCVGYELVDSSVLWVDLDEVVACIREVSMGGDTTIEALPWLEQADTYIERGALLEGESSEWCIPICNYIHDAVNQCRQWLIEIYERQGKFQQAREQIYKLLNANPDNEGVKRYCEEMRQRINSRSLVVPFMSTVPTFLENKYKNYGPTLQACEDMLKLAWNAFYTSNAQRSASIVDHWLLLLNQPLYLTDTTLGDQLHAIRCHFLQLGSVLARDRADFQRAFDYIHNAISIAFHLENAELIASSLYRRAKIYSEQQRYNLAVQDLEASFPFAKRSRKPLRYYISTFLAELYSLMAPGNREFQRKSLNLLDSVDQVVRTYGILEGDGSFVKVDVPGLYLIHSDVLRRAGEINESRKALQVVQENLTKDFIRWRGNMALSEAQLFFADNDIENSCNKILNALDLFQENGSRNGIEKTHRLYHTLQETEPSHPRVKAVSLRFI
jgi:DNA-binding SARP family transcriptional activator